jgi:hypothetical protein
MKTRTGQSSRQSRELSDFTSRTHSGHGLAGGRPSRTQTGAWLDVDRPPANAETCR